MTGKRTVQLPCDAVQFKVVDVAFCMSTEYESWDRAINLIHGGEVAAEKLITHRERLENFVYDPFQL